MYVDVIIWDDENEPHITGPGEVTTGETFQEVIHRHPGSHDDPDDYSASTRAAAHFWRHLTGKHIVVVFEDLSDDDLIIIRPKQPTRSRNMEIDMALPSDSDRTRGPGEVTR